MKKLIIVTCLIMLASCGNIRMSASPVKVQRGKAFADDGEVLMGDGRRKAEDWFMFCSVKDSATPIKNLCSLW